MLLAASLLCGFLFGWGLLIAGMTDTQKVLGFLDLFGAWDPSLAVVMAAALIVAIPGFLLLRRRSRSFLAQRILWSDRKDLDARLIVGSTMFGIGWGMVGLCPGPALENLASLSPQVIVFVVAMAGGVLLHDLWQPGVAMRSRRPSMVDG